MAAQPAPAVPCTHRRRARCCRCPPARAAYGQAKDAGCPAGHPEPPKALAKLIESCWAQKASSRPAMADVFQTFEDKVKPALLGLKADIGTPSSSAAGAAEEGEQGQSLAEFLGAAKLPAKHVEALHKCGFSDVLTLCDRELVTDEVSPSARRPSCPLELRQQRPFFVWRTCPVGAPCTRRPYC